MCITIPCGYSSQTLAKLIAYADIIFSFLTFVSLWALWEISCGSHASYAPYIFSQAFFQYYSSTYTCKFVSETYNGNLRALLIAIAVFYSLGTLILGFILLYGARNRSLMVLGRWLQISMSLLLVRFILYTTWILYSPPDGRMGPFFLAFFNSFYNVVTIGMIYKFYKQVAQEVWRGKRYNYKYYY